jgi:hypothetical protein
VNAARTVGHADNCRCLDCMLDKLALEAALVLELLPAARGGDVDALDELCAAAYEVGDGAAATAEVLVHRDGKLALARRLPKPVLRPGPRALP